MNGFTSISVVDLQFLFTKYIKTWHILGDRLIPLAPLSLVGF